MQKEYIWLDDVPVAIVDESGAAPVLYFVHTDQLGTPQKITNPAAAIIWDGVFDPFGNVQFVSGAGIWDTSTWDNFLWGADLSLTNLRFPGQYADAETTLSQNWFRDYDPTIGRYIQSDPIGLRGGSNTYGYVRGNPVSLTDPNGRLGFLAAAGILALTGAVSYGGTDLLAQLIKNGWRTECLNWGEARVAAAKGFFIGATFVAPGLLALRATNASAAASSVAGSGVDAAGALASATDFSAIGSTRRVGEEWLANNLGGTSNKYFSTSQGARYVDQFVNAIANESKVGYTSLTLNVQTQILKDVELLQTQQFQGVNWHFFNSPVTGLGGPSMRLLNTLLQNGINVILH